MKKIDLETNNFKHADTFFTVVGVTEEVLHSTEDNISDRNQDFEEGIFI